MQRFVKMVIATVPIAFGTFGQPAVYAASDNIPVKFSCKPLPKTDPFGVWEKASLDEAAEWRTAKLCNAVVSGPNFKYLVSYLNGAGCSNILCPAKLADVADPKNVKVIMVDMVCQDLSAFSITRDGKKLISCDGTSPLDGQLAP